MIQINLIRAGKNALKIHYPGKGRKELGSIGKKGLERMSKNTYIPPSKVCSTSAFRFNTYVVCVDFVPMALAVTMHRGQNINSFVQIMNTNTSLTI